MAQPDALGGCAYTAGPPLCLILPQPMARAVPLHDPEGIAMARAAARLAAEVLDMVTPHVQPGITTDELDRICHQHIVEHQRVRPANLGYHGYPKTILTSVNQVVCHGIPSATQTLRRGDIVNIDVAVQREGWFGDTSRMYVVGEAAPKARHLVDTCHEALMAGIAQVRPGATLGDVGHAIQAVARREGYSVVREYCGHGIGQIYHDVPEVLHFGRPGQGLRLQAGMIFTIEPMLNAGHPDVVTLKDGWTVVTKDRSLSAQWEHMVLVTPSGSEILTLSPMAAQAA